MNATAKSLLFWVVLIVVGAAHLEASLERSSGSRPNGSRPRSRPQRQGAVVDPEAKLKELGITLPTPGAPIANYVNAVQTGNLLFLAGKGPLPQDGKDVVGRLGKDMTIEQGYQAARSTAIAHLAVLKKELGDLKRVHTDREGAGDGEFRPGLHAAAGRRQRLLGFDGRGLRRKGEARALGGGHGDPAGRHPGRGRSDCRDRAG